MYLNYLLTPFYFKLILLLQFFIKIIIISLNVTVFNYIYFHYVFISMTLLHAEDIIVCNAENEK